MPPNGRNFSRDAARARGDRDVVLHTLAAGQHGVVGRGQLLAAGLAVWEIDNRLRNGRLEMLHRAVYRVPGADPRPSGAREGGRPRVRRRRAGEPRHRGAAPEPAPAHPPRGPGRGAGRERLPSPRPHHPGPARGPSGRGRPGGRRRRPGHRGSEAPAGPRPGGPPPHAGARRRLGGAGGGGGSGSTSGRRRETPRTRGARVLRELLGRDDAPAFVRSGAEARLLEITDVAGLPRPRTNVMVEDFEVDCLWPEQRLVVEVDGRVPRAPGRPRSRPPPRRRAHAGRVPRDPSHLGADLPGADRHGGAPGPGVLRGPRGSGSAPWRLKDRRRG